MALRVPDYNALARAFRLVVETLSRQSDPRTYAKLREAAQNVASHCKAGNSHFDTGRFLREAGFDE